MIILFVLVSVLALSVETSIDWSTCGIETQCFCPELSQPGVLAEQAPDYGGVPIDRVTEEMIIDQIDQIKAKCEKVGMQSRFLSDNVALLQMQVTGELTKISKLFLENTPSSPPTNANEPTKPLTFGCDFSAQTPTLIVLEDPKNTVKNMKKIYKINGLFENLSYSKVGSTVCAVKIDQARKLSKFLLNKHKSELMKDGILAGKLNKARDFIDAQKILCNPYSFKVIPPIILTEYRVQPLKNHDKNEWTCEDKQYSMRYMNTTDKSEKMDKLKCKKDGNSFYFYINTTDSEFKIEYPETFSIFCAAHFAETCERPVCNPDSRTTCPEFEAGRGGNKATLQCKDKKWVMKVNDKDEFMTMEDPECKKDVLGDGKAAAFYFTLPSGSVDKKDNPRCFTDHDCKHHSGLVLPCANETSCFMVDQTKDEIKCKNESDAIQLTVYMKEDDQNGNWSDLRSYTCDKNTGLYTNGDRAIPRKSVVRCKGEPKKEEPKQTAQEISYAVIGGVTGGFILLIFIAYFSWDFRRKRKYKLRLKGRDAWRKMKDKDERIKTCKETFAQIFNASADTDTAENVLAGFDFIETMLDADTEDPECWAEAYVFLKKFHGAIMKIDHQIWHMFSRYMYLQSKQIIDKHGWISPKLIRKDSRKGLIRTVAIHFLGFAVFNPKNCEAEDLIVEGFQQLQYNSWTQYPHCGLLWSVLTHVRPLASKVLETADTAKPGANIMNFDRLKFLNYMNERMRVKQGLIPHEMIIPEFGTISYQAAFAIGASPALCFHEDWSAPIVTPNQPNLTKRMFGFTDSGNVPIGFIDGLNETISRDPAFPILSATRSPYSLDKDYEYLLKFWGTADEWNVHWQRGLHNAVYYGRGMDAKKLFNRFIADVKIAEVVPQGAEGVNKPLKQAQEKKTKNQEQKAPPKDDGPPDPNAKPPLQPGFVYFDPEMIFHMDNGLLEKCEDYERVKAEYVAKGTTPPIKKPIPIVKAADPAAGGDEDEDGVPNVPAPAAAAAAPLAEDKTAPMDNDAAAGAAPPAAPLAEDKTMPMVDPSEKKKAAPPAAAPKAAIGNAVTPPAAALAAAAAPAADAAAPAAAPVPAADAAAAPAAAAHDTADPFKQTKEDPSHQLELAQQEFSDAIEFILESLRKWFAKRTDKEELKAKPVYPVDDKFNLDNRISKDKKTDVEGDKRNPDAGGACESSNADDPARSPIIKSSNTSNSSDTRNSLVKAASSKKVKKTNKPAPPPTAAAAAASAPAPVKP